MEFRIRNKYEDSESVIPGINIGGNSFFSLPPDITIQLRGPTTPYHFYPAFGAEDSVMYILDQ
jgi:hypothetical protein